mmetsp:Transcript_24259/g.27643  ORF Transcript_24259/g.27643 Transcript_24259/m.27643 type:complete len:226 (+) Transcript_24259:181-858(+)
MNALFNFCTDVVDFRRGGESRENNKEFPVGDADESSEELQDAVSFVTFKICELKNVLFLSICFVLRSILASLSTSSRKFLPFLLLIPLESCWVVRFSTVACVALFDFAISSSALSLLISSSFVMLLLISIKRSSSAQSISYLTIKFDVSYPKSLSFPRKFSNSVSSVSFPSSDPVNFTCSVLFEDFTSISFSSNNNEFTKFISCVFKFFLLVLPTELFSRSFILW